MYIIIGLIQCCQTFVYTFINLFVCDYNNSHGFIYANKVSVRNVLIFNYIEKMF